jgi:hypothetical protein
MKKIINLIFALLFVVVLMVTVGQQMFVKADELFYVFSNNCTHLVRLSDGGREWQTDDQGVAVGAEALYWVATQCFYLENLYFRRMLGPDWWYPTPSYYVGSVVLND